MEEISHKGVVLSAAGGSVKVGIISESACKTCAAAGLCTAAEAQKKEVEALTDEKFAVGETVTVYLSRSLGSKAVLFCYVIPLAILTLITVALAFSGVGELSCAAAGIGGMALYYLSLSFFKDRFSKEYKFIVKRS